MGSWAGIRDRDRRGIRSGLHEEVTVEGSHFRMGKGGGERAVDPARRNKEG